MMFACLLGSVVCLWLNVWCCDLNKSQLQWKPRDTDWLVNDLNILDLFSWPFCPKQHTISVSTLKIHLKKCKNQTFKKNHSNQLFRGYLQKYIALSTMHFLTLLFYNFIRARARLCKALLFLKRFLLLYFFLTGCTFCPFSPSWHALKLLKFGSHMWNCYCYSETEVWPRVWLRDSIAPPNALSSVVDTYIHENVPDLVEMCVVLIWL